MVFGFWNTFKLTFRAMWILVTDMSDCCYWANSTWKCHPYDCTSLYPHLIQKSIWELVKTNSDSLFLIRPHLWTQLRSETPRLNQITASLWLRRISNFVKTWKISNLISKLSNRKLPKMCVIGSNKFGLVQGHFSFHEKNLT